MIIKRILIGFAIFFLVMIALWSAVVTFVVTPEFLTPQLQALGEQSVKSEFSVKSVDVSLFRRFPNITLKIDSLRITQTKDSIGDLLFARECRVAVDPMSLLFKKIVVNHLSLRDARIYVYVDSLHGPLKTFNLPEESEEEADTLSNFDVSKYSFILRRMKIDSLQLVIDDRTRDFFTRMNNFSADASLTLSSSVSKLKLESGFEDLFVKLEGKPVVRKTSMNLSSKLMLDADSMKLSFHQADVRINGIDLKSSGSLRQDSTSGNMKIDVTASLNTPSLTEFLALIPKSVMNDKDKITTQGSVALEATIQGEYGQGVVPTVSAKMLVEDAKAKYASRKLALESVNCDAFMFLDMNNPESSYADIKRLYVNTSGIISLDVNGKISSLLDNPQVDMAVKSNIDFDRFTEVFPLNEGVVCSGSNVSDIKAQFSVNDVIDSNFAKLYIDGESTFKGLDISFDASKFAQDSSSTAYLYMNAREGKMLFGDRIISDNDSRTLRAKINFSDMGYKSKSGEFVMIKDIELAGGANFDRTTSEVNGFGIRGVAKNMEAGVDSLFSSTLESSDVTFTVTPKKETRPASFTMKIVSEQITANEPNFNSEMSLSTVNMDVKAERASEEEEWSMNGTVGFSNLEMFTDLFPLDIKIPQTSVAVGNRAIYLTNAEMSIGESELFASGQINNLIRKLFVDPRLALSGELSITASTLNVTELMEASTESILLFEELFEEESTTSEEVVLVAEATATENSEEQEPMIQTLEIESEDGSVIEVEYEVEVKEEPRPEAREQAPQDSLAQGDDRAEGERAGGERQPSDSLSRRGNRRGNMVQSNSIFLVPRRVSFIFDLNVAKAYFEDAVIENVTGRATIERGVLSLDRLTLEAIGAQAEGSMTYRNIDSRSSNVALNMTLNGVDINRIGELMPSINTMFPMLESFEGDVDFDLKANTNLVDDAEIDVTTLRSAMLFKGRNLVLMDSETFDSLSKTLMFKNKDRNLIDSLEVYALVDQNKVDVLPFSVSIDRYTAIVGGTQLIDPETFDVDYEYNVSIMKSPLPFKAGVDITGNLEDFKFKVTTAKLKNTDFEEQKAIYEEYRGTVR
ncbi:MAG: AsmA-like C-terminal region-containing protein [Rikenellaceae bacterium]